MQFTRINLILKYLHIVLFTSFIFTSPDEDLLDQGIFKLYNYELAESIQLLDSAIVRDPDHPVTPFVAIAAKWLYIQTTDGYKASYDVINREVENTIPIYENFVKENPNNAEYLLYLGATYGIRARVGLALKSWLQVIYSGYQGYAYTIRAQKIDTTLTDVYTPIGLLEYFSGISSPPVKWAAVIAGITPDPVLGVKHLEDAVSGGGFSRIEAANVLSYIYLYFLDQPENTLRHIAPLSEEHPLNPFFAALRGEALASTGQWDKLEVYYSHLEALAVNGPFLQQNETQLKVKHIRAIQAFAYEDWQQTIELCTWIIDNYHMEFDWLLGKAHLLRGKCYDILGDRRSAVGDYIITSKLDNYFPDRDAATKLLKHPYQMVAN